MTKETEKEKTGRLLGIHITTGLQGSDGLVQFFLHRLILRDFGSELDRVDLVVVPEDGDRCLESRQRKVSETVAGTGDWSLGGGVSRDICGKELEKHRRGTEGTFDQLSMEEPRPGTEMR